ncbi:MAG: TOBE domain-containing protein, partial [Thermomicrobia bacterium]|nr:TOBE domain-containing protein [Thermomicrobia bacterium]
TALGPLRLGDAVCDGSDMMIGIRPEHIAMHAGENAVTGRVTSRTYLGQHQRVTLRISESDTEVTVLAPAEMPIASGQEITISLPAKRLRVIAHA